MQNLPATPGNTVSWGNTKKLYQSGSSEPRIFVFLSALPIQPNSFQQRYHFCGVPCNCFPVCPQFGQRVFCPSVFQQFSPAQNLTGRKQIFMVLQNRIPLFHRCIGVSSSFFLRFQNTRKNSANKDRTRRPLQRARWLLSPVWGISESPGWSAGALSAMT